MLGIFKSFWVNFEINKSKIFLVAKEGKGTECSQDMGYIWKYSKKAY